MLLFVLGLVLFLGVHSVSIVAEPWRNAMVEKLGELPWKGLYSLLSLVGLALIVVGYGQARSAPTVLFVPPVATRHAVLLLMLPFFPLLLATYLPGRISAAVKHPMLTSVKLWAFAHLLANGMLHDLMLFGGFLAWAVVDRISMKRRTPRVVPGAPPSPRNDAIAVGLGLVLYAAFVMGLHKALIGVAPIAMGG
jgi:uncharacterized membrane protein